jgi:actin-related protein 5
MRCGFASDPVPRLACPPQVARYMDRKIGRKYTFGGYDVNVDATARGQSKSVFDGNVVSNFDALEMLLDYSFIKLGLEGGPDGGVGHPILITEAVCNPSYSRKSWLFLFVLLLSPRLYADPGCCIVVTELIFEGYNAPSLTYGIDALFSYNYNGGRTGLVLSSGNTATHLIPVVDGKGLIPLTTRLNWGGSQGTEFMLKLVQLKYPAFPSKLASWQAEALAMDHCYVSRDYKFEAENYLAPGFLEVHDRVIQFPYTETVKIEKSQAELDKIAEKRKESGRRLQEQAAKARLEKV